MLSTTSISPSARRAFTLIEFLTVIAIIGVLAAIIIPTVGRVRESARAAHCTSNLRQLGSGILLHSQANKDRLPGPLFTAQGPRFTSGNLGNGVLAAFLEPYVTSNTPLSNGTSKVQELLNCPSWAASTPDPTGPSMQMNLFPSNWDARAPFGNASTSLQPLTQGQISAYAQSRTWLMVDVDQPWLGSARPDWYPRIPAKETHVSSRNCLYYDGHVGRIPAGSQTGITF